MQIDVKTTQSRTIIDFRKAGYSDLCVLGRYKYNRAEKNLEEHVHKGMIEICYCDKGSQLFVVNNKKYFVKGGDIFIHFPGEVHSSGDMPEEKGCMYWFIIKTVNNKTKPGTFTCANVAFLLDLLIKKKIRHFHAGSEIKKILETFFETKTIHETSEIKNIRIQLLVQTFLLRLLDKSSASITEIKDKRLHTIINYISTKLTEPLTVPILAKEVNLSQSRFKNWFKELTGFTPIDFIQRQRITAAIKMIKEQPDVSLSTLAYNFNFSSPQYLSTVMKKYTGKTPTQVKGG